MTLETYSELQAEVAAFLNRDDLTAQIPSFIRLAEASMNRKVRHWRMEKRVSATVTGQYADLPVDWLETIRYHVPGVRRLKLLSQAEMMDKREIHADAAGAPCFYAHTTGEIEHYPTPNEDVTTELVYYASLDSLSDDTTSNWLLTTSPDAYLYGALLHSAPFLLEDERIGIWGGLYKDALTGLNAASNQARTSGSGLARR